MRGPFRLPNTRPGAELEFSFDGRILKGLQGDTVASALLANGVRVVSRSFKYHRPRGIFSAGYEEPNALVQVHAGERAIPCARATLIPLTPGLQISTEPAWPSRRFDALRAIDGLHTVFAAGFYNRTFIWPSWRWYEPIIRKLAGFGRVPPGPDPDRYDERHVHCDVLVIGGGPAGIEAACAAARRTERVMLVEQGTRLGQADLALHDFPNLQLLLRTTAFGYYDHDLVALTETVGDDEPGRPRERLWLVRAKRVILATGAIEQPLIFSNNDRPGILLAGAARQYLHRHGIAPGHEVVIATNNDSAYEVACELRQAGVNVVALLDSRKAPPEKAVQALREANIPLQTQSMPIDTQGFSALKQVIVGRLSGESRAANPSQRIRCDTLLVSGGWSPTLHLFAQAGGKLGFEEASRTFRPLAQHPGIEIVGAARMADSGELGERVSPVGNPARQWVDLRHDVTVADIELSVRENFAAVEHIKRYTTLGMAVDQGKLGQAPAIEVIARVREMAPSKLGHTTFRPPFVPVTLGTMVGRQVGALYAPTRRSPLHALQLAAGGLFEDYGEWRRAAAFPRLGESREKAVAREVRLIRHGLGLYDASPLGKIELSGPDALAFADRFYINNLLTLKPGRARYGIMLRETGVIFDDGTIVILDEDRILLTTTSSGAAKVAAWLEEWRQCEWPDSRVVVTPVTDQWATLALTGQCARTVLGRLKPECDLGNAAFPHLGFRVTRLLGMEARIYRVSFSGELTYEINVPRDQGPNLWAALLEEGAGVGIQPYGIEALLHTRMEKGFIHIGSDTDGTTVPADIGFGAVAASKNTHYVGKRSLTFADHTRADRLQLVGLRSEGASSMPVGSHLRLSNSTEPTDGWITSAGLSSVDRAPIALAVLRAGRSQLGGTVSVHDAGHAVAKATVVSTSFYAPSGSRMHA